MLGTSSIWNFVNYTIKRGIIIVQDHFDMGTVAQVRASFAQKTIVLLFYVKSERDRENEFENNYQYRPLLP